MDIRTVDTTLSAWQGEALVLTFFEDETSLTGELSQLDQQLSGAITELIDDEKFDGKAKSFANTRISGSVPVRKLLLVGLGKADAYDLQSVRTTGAMVARTLKAANIQSVGISLLVTDDKSATVQAIAEGIFLASHQDRRFKSETDDEGGVNSIELLGFGDEQAAITTAEQVASGVILARELVAAPANSVTPITMAETAADMASEYGLTLEVLEKEDCEQLGMGAYLGVAQASDMPPKFIHLTYKPARKPRAKVAIVGKGLTFDSGGLNIKGAGSGIETMKMDMGGGAATLGAAKAIAQLKPEVEVHFISAATENMISGRAMHPGDILTASNGKTIEVNNTDAEGRLTLADALVFAEKLKVDAIVDLATLTGACVVALGENIAGLWSTDDSLSSGIQAAADKAGEKFWVMPMEEGYFDGLKSPIADMKNTGPRAGGSITAALFLKQFIQETPWAHLDVAGPVWTKKAFGVNNEGATGFPVRTLVNWVLDFKA
ncbi:MAG: leucyl aminopeptidase [Cyanobacteria bacterium P01_H01_bin.15]